MCLHFPCQCGHVKSWIESSEVVHSLSQLVATATITDWMSLSKLPHSNHHLMYLAGGSNLSKCIITSD